MLRTGLCSAIALSVITPALAQLHSPSWNPSSPGPVLRTPIDISRPLRATMHYSSENDDAAIPQRSDWQQGDPSRGFSLGPLHACACGIGGRHAHRANFQVEGVKVFGGNVGGSVDGRSANIVLTWPASP
ncbi:MAG TPA: hypothetical protein VGK90_10115 [Rhizomicrobium sp.]|jgi:hypothetical protein